MDFGQDFFTLRFPQIAFRLQIAQCEVFFYGDDQLPHACEASAPNRILRKVGKEALDQIQP